MEILKYPEKSKWKDLLKRPDEDISVLYDTVSGIIDQVNYMGDKAVIELTRRFDGVSLESLAVTPEEIESAGKNIDPDLKTAIRISAENIEKFHQAQLLRSEAIETRPGVRCWQKAVPIERVGLYIPGGSAPLISTVLMLGVPARLAGCQKIVLCTPPGKEGTVHPAILYTAGLLGIQSVYRAGGAQAIAAMAFGTETIPSVDKIFGPGNQYVTAAKMLLSRDKVAIDMPAGPSEVMVVADESAEPAFVASDLLSQAEHGINSQVVLITSSEAVIEKVKIELDRQLETLPRKKIAAGALQNSRMFLLRNSDEIIDMVNLYAPEHLILAVKNYRIMADQVVNAGSVFLGNYSPESAGDYASGTNHTLPTNGWARAYSGVNMDSYMKKITFQEISQQGLNEIGKAVMTMAEAESLMAHSRAISIRLNDKGL